MTPEQVIALALAGPLDARAPFVALDVADALRSAELLAGPVCYICGKSAEATDQMCAKCQAEYDAYMFGWEVL